MSDLRRGNTFSGTSAELAAPSAVDRLQRRSLLVGIISAVGCVVGAVIEPQQFFRSYLLGFMVCLGLTTGSLALLLMQYLTKGNWGFAIRRQLEAATRNIPLVALLFIPVIIGMHQLYPWAQPLKPEDAALAKMQHYLRPGFFVLRAAIYFLLWFLLASLLNRWGKRQDVEDEPDLIRSRRYQKLSGPGMVIYAVSISVAAVDWVMSLDPHWYSTIYGLIFIDGQGLLAMSFCIVLSFFLMRYRPLSEVLNPTVVHDLGKLTLAMVMIWAYFSFSQFLIIWSGNLPEEIEWYLARVTGGWQWVGLAILLFHFVVPFSLLLSRRLKRNAGSLAKIAVCLLIMRYVDLFWYIAPNFPDRRGHFHYSWLDLAAPLAILGIWLAAFCRQLKSRPLFPVYDPLWQEVAKHHHEPAKA